MGMAFGGKKGVMAERAFEDVARAIGIMRTSGIETVGLMIEGNGRS